MKVETKFTFLEKSDRTVLIKYNGHDSEVKLPNNIEIIGDHAFEHCLSLTIVIIPGCVKEIGDYAFKDCKNLSALVITEGVEVIGEGTFSGCNNLASISITGNLEEIKTSAFDNLGKREINVVYQHTSPVITILGEDGSNVINLLDRDRNLIGKLVNLDEQTDGPFVEFIVRLISGKVKHLSEYDALFSGCKKTAMEKKEIAVARLQYPLELNNEYKDEYRSYLQMFAHYHLPILIQLNDIAIINTLAKFNVIFKQDIDALIEQAMQLGQTEIQAFLIDYKHKTWGQDPTPITMLSDEVDPHDWLTMENSDGSLTIKKFIGSSQINLIPSKLYDKQVKKIEGWKIGEITFNMFSIQSDNIISINIEEGIEVIGERTFYKCDKLEYVAVPTSVREICKEVFYGCDNLVIHAPKGSYAAEFAKVNNINYVET